LRNVVKAIETIAKTLLALVAGLLLKRAPRPLGAVKKVLLVRPDARVGEALLMTPLLEALGGRCEVDVLVHERCVRVLEGHPKVRKVIGLDRRALALGAWAPGIKPLRAERYDVVVSCANWEVPSVTSALVARLAGPGAVVIGPAVGATARLMDIAVPARADTASEIAQRLELLRPLGGEPQLLLPSFREPRVSDAVRALLERKLAVVNPGGRLDERRVPAQVFAAACRTLLERGRTPLVTWGPGEEALAREVVAAAPGAVLAPATSLDDLAALMRSGGLTVCNNTGPMHLSVAVGCPTLALFLNMPIGRWGYREVPHRAVDLTSFAGMGDRMSEEVVKVVQEMVAPPVVAPAVEPVGSPDPSAAAVEPVASPAPTSGASPVVEAAPLAVPAPPPEKQKRPGGFDLPKRLLAQLRRVESERGRDGVAQNNDAFLMDADAPSPSYLTWDGHVMVVDGGTVRDATEDEKIAAVVAGARKTGLTVLLNLLPPRSPNAVTCSSCEGGRWKDERLVCPACHGRGWQI
jgi:ADP-heptose:LPS heptosyltransferase